jgi:hypothetical protein
MVAYCARQRLSLLAAFIFLLWGVDAFAHGVSVAQQQALIDGGIQTYIYAGGLHMVTGYDHLLFLFGVMFFLTSFREIATFVTAFTLGHSISLVFATLNGITANHFLIDAVIAISVAYKGFDNLDGFRKFVGIEPPNLLAMVFGFGLIHGFGLSARLQDLPLPHQGLVARILAFNAGVELGQIAALIPMVAILAVARRTRLFKPFAVSVNAGLVCAGALLFLYQMHGYLHTTRSDAFGFSRDEHFHHHKELGDALPTPTNSSEFPPLE